MQLLNVFLVLFLQFIFLTSCVKEKDPEIIEKTININNALQLDSAQISWIIEDIPDSIPVKIKNGKAPYSISTYPSFSSTAKIKDDKLLVFPTEFRFAELGRDFITIADAENQQLTLPIIVETALSPYNHFLIIDVQVQGDTTFMSDRFIVQDAFWEYYEGVLYLKLRYNDQGITIWIKDIFERGDYAPKQFSYSPNINEFPNGDYEFVPRDSAQTITVDSLSTNNVQVTFDFPAIDKRNHFNGNVRLFGQLKMINKK